MLSNRDGELLEKSSSAIHADSKRKKSLMHILRRNVAVDLAVERLQTVVFVCFGVELDGSIEGLGRFTQTQLFYG